MPFKEFKLASLSSPGLLEASQESGFFYVTEHGIPPNLLEEVFKAATEFFALHETEKNQYHDKDRLRYKRIIRKHAEYETFKVYPASLSAPLENLHPLISDNFHKFEEIQKHLHRIGTSILLALEEVLGYDPGHFIHAHTYGSPSGGDTMFLKYPKTMVDKEHRGEVRMDR
ncbi:hypothetical protein DSO57_1010658 [Entomophthora muscae]|uniref:Uncharacterized protein n=1 Tax=Entomophthora muscae TaxID=34485 RepID=A0ACC2RXJ0_9FUNG|nr:hypothetical protein DSO57_1010658 [Entomophthora muscae]